MAIKNWTDGDYVGAVDLDDLTKRVNHIYSTTTAANTALTGDLAPTAGMRLWTTTDNIMWTYIASGFNGWVPVAGTVLTDVYATADQTLTTSGTNYNITSMTQITVNRASAWNAAQGKFTAPYPGNYLFNQSATFASNATGVRQLSFKIGGASTAIGSLRNAPAINGVSTTVHAAHVQLLAQGETMEPQVYQTSGASLVMNSSTATGYSAKLTVIYQGL